MFEIIFQKIKNLAVQVWFLWALCLIFNIITFFFIFFKIHPGKTPLALHYNVLVGVEWYGNGRNLYLIPIVGLAIAGINFTLYRSLKDRHDFLPELPVFVSLAVEIILLAAAMLLAKVN